MEDVDLRAVVARHGDQAGDGLHLGDDGAGVAVGAGIGAALGLQLLDHVLEDLVVLGVEATAQAGALGHQRQRLEELAVVGGGDVADGLTHEDLVADDPLLGHGDDVLVVVLGEQKAGRYLVAELAHDRAILDRPPIEIALPAVEGLAIEERLCHAFAGAGRHGILNDAIVNALNVGPLPGSLRAGFLRAGFLDNARRPKPR